jgi:hypothetical protein
MSVRIVEDPINSVQEWVREHGGTCLWRESQRHGRISCYRVIDEEGTPKIFLVQEFRGSGCEVYLPATDKDMTAALDEWFTA